MKQWGAKDGTFNLGHFYHLIIRTLEDEEDQWVKETMEWWQRYDYSYFLSLHICSHSCPFYRKVFGDDTSNSAKTKKRIHLNTQTAYQLMKKQKRQATGGTGEGEQQVRIHYVYEGPHC